MNNKQECYDCKNYYTCVDLNTFSQDEDLNPNYKYWQHNGKDCPDFKNK